MNLIINKHVNVKKSRKLKMLSFLDMFVEESH